MCFDRHDQKLLCFDQVRLNHMFRASSTEEKRFDRVRPCSRPQTHARVVFIFALQNYSLSFATNFWPVQTFATKFRHVQTFATATWLSKLKRPRLSVATFATETETARPKYRDPFLVCSDFHDQDFRGGDGATPRVEMLDLLFDRLEQKSYVSLDSNQTSYISTEGKNSVLVFCF